jgi:hypothetical protein
VCAAQFTNILERFVDLVRNITRLSPINTQYSLSSFIYLRRLAIKPLACTAVGFQCVCHTTIFRNTSNQSFMAFLMTVTCSREKRSRGMESEVWISLAMRFRLKVLLTPHYTSTEHSSSPQYLSILYTIRSLLVKGFAINVSLNGTLIS